MNLFSFFKARKLPCANTSLDMKHPCSQIHVNKHYNTISPKCYHVHGSHVGGVYRGTTCVCPWGWTGPKRKELPTLDSLGWENPFSIREGGYPFIWPLWAWNETTFICHNFGCLKEQASVLQIRHFSFEFIFQNIHQSKLIRQRL